MIFDGHHPPVRRLHGRADGGEIDVVDERVVDDRGLHAFLGQLLAGIDGLVEQGAAADEHHVAAL